MSERVEKLSPVALDNLRAVRDERGPGSIDAWSSDLLHDLILCRAERDKLRVEVELLRAVLASARAERDRLRAEVERLKATRPKRTEVVRLMNLYISAVDSHAYADGCTAEWASDSELKEMDKIERDRLRALLDYVCGPEAPEVPDG